MTAPARGILQLDLTQPVKDLGPSQDGHDVPVVLRAGPLALGQLVVPAAELPMPSARLRELAATTVAAAVGQHLLGAHFDPPLPERRPSRPRPAAPRSYGTVPSRPLSALARTHVAAVAAEPTGTPAFSVIICTRNRPQQLVGALAAVARLDPAQAEVVVVDNTPRDGRTGQVVDTFPGVRYVCEPVPGLSVARNAGVRASTGELLAFTDDDARPSPGWIAHLATAFADPQVGWSRGSSCRRRSTARGRGSSSGQRASDRATAGAITTCGSSTGCGGVECRSGAWTPGPTWPRGAGSLSSWAPSTNGSVQARRGAARTRSCGAACSRPDSAAATRRRRRWRTSTAKTSAPSADRPATTCGTRQGAVRAVRPAPAAR